MVIPGEECHFDEFVSDWKHQLDIGLEDHLPKTSRLQVLNG